MTRSSLTARRLSGSARRAESQSRESGRHTQIGMGPFEYIPGSTGEGPYANVWEWEPLGESYPNQREFEERFPDATVRTFTGKKGALIFCDTSGFHRGGLSTTNPRVLATVTYSSPASLAALTERNFRYTGSLDELDDTTRFAVS